LEVIFGGRHGRRSKSMGKKREKNISSHKKDQSRTMPQEKSREAGRYGFSLNVLKRTVGTILRKNKKIAKRGVSCTGNSETPVVEIPKS